MKHLILAVMLIISSLSMAQNMHEFSSKGDTIVLNLDDSESLLVISKEDIFLYTDDGEFDVTFQGGDKFVYMDGCVAVAHNTYYTLRSTKRTIKVIYGEKELKINVRTLREKNR
jgi:hypothetical protein